jgi:hypothetical protein
MKKAMENMMDSQDMNNKLKEKLERSEKAA